MLIFKTIIYLLFDWSLLAHGYHILAIFPQGFASHFLFNTAMLNALTEAGHDVIFITPFNASFTENYRVDASVEINFKPNVTPATQLKTAGIRRRNKYLQVSRLGILHSWTASEALHCSDMMELPDIKGALAGRIHYDAILTEMLSTSGCYLLLARKLNIPIVGTVPMTPWISERLVGNPINPTYVPNAWTHAGNSMTLYSRVKNTLLTGTIYLWEMTVSAVREELFRRKYFPEIEWSDVGSTDLLFLNSHPTLQPRPMVPNAIEVGGLHIPPDSPLPEKLQTFIDEAEHGVILLTFGTNRATNIGYEKRLFSSAFASIPQRVIWKLEHPYENVSDNVLVANWIPQHDVLRQKNVLAFISHCGAFGMQEAVHTATPVIGVPLHIDQVHNSLVLEELGVGIHLDTGTLTKEKLMSAIKNVINDTRYQENMQKLSNQFKDNPMTAAEKIVYWTEYVIRHKETPYLQTMGAKMSFYQHIYIDVIIGLAVVSTLIILSIIYTAKVCTSILAVKNVTLQVKKVK